MTRPQLDDSPTGWQTVDFWQRGIMVHETVAHQALFKASTVPRIRGAMAGRKPIRGIMSRLASSYLQP